MPAEMPLGLTYDDVLIVPRRSSIASRHATSTRSRFTREIEVESPIISANMDTITTAPMAIVVAEAGGIGVIHRFLTPEEQAEEVWRVKRYRTQLIEDPYTISPEQTVDEARLESEWRGVTGLLVTDPDGHLLGLLTARDMRAEAGETKVRNAMTPRERLVTAQREIDLDAARTLMHRNRIEKLPLTEDGNQLVGLITLRDIEHRERYPRSTRDHRGRLRVAAAVGVREAYMERAERLLDAGADALVVDIAHGHSDHAIDATRRLKQTWPGTPVVAGNVASPEGFHDLVEAGADGVKVGIGPGLVCSTRMVAGTGVPQLTAVIHCAEISRQSGVPLIADGGIRDPGDFAKAMAAGASTVMIGSLLAGRTESPGEVVRKRGELVKVYRGMASRAAAQARLALEGRTEALDQYVPEGEEVEFPVKGSATEVVDELLGGLRSGMSYVGAATIAEFWEQATFIRQTEAGQKESRPREQPS